MFRYLVLMMFLAPTVVAIADDGTQITTRLEGNTLVWSTDQPHGGATLSLVGPDGKVLTRQINSEQRIALQLDREATEEGQYLYELTLAPKLTERQQQILAEARLSGVAPSFEAKGIRHSGSFRRMDGEWFGGFTEQSEEYPLQDHTDSASPRDQLINDDLIVTGSVCVGFDCVNGEAFGFDTARLKENNTRLTFIDTSTGTFAAGDWQLRANDSASGGANFMAIDWLGTAATSGDAPQSTPFLIEGDAPSDSLRIDSSGRIGVGTPNPAVELHVRNGDSPTLRLEQDISSGFGAQTWDLAGNETNFFVRDSTNGSTLPFRVFPGSASSSLVIRDSNVGVGTSSPAAKLHVSGGDLRVDGTVYQLSSRAAKTDLTAMDAGRLLDLLSSLDLFNWRYQSTSSQGLHFGPTAEDFYALFGLGESDRHISVADMAGVALGAAQALQQELAAKDQELERLNARLERLERMFDDTANE